jgi:hypothetical protein
VIDKLLSHIILRLTVYEFCEENLMKNQIVKALLRSPLHGLVSNKTLLITFKDRHSGAEIEKPCAYSHVGNTVTCFTSLNEDWWRSLTEEAHVRVRIKDREVAGTARTVTFAQDREMLINKLTSVYPNLSYDDAASKAPQMVMIQIELATTPAQQDVRNLAT